MARQPTPRRHHTISRRSIAEAGLAIVDAEGLQALNLRAVATALSVGTMTLYTYVDSRDTIVSDIVGLLLSEIDASYVEGETWEESIRRVANSARAMARRHPKAFELVAVAPINEPPVLDYAQAIAQLHAHQGIPEAVFASAWGLVDSFLTGFLLMETQAMCRPPSGHPTYAPPESLAGRMPQALSSKTFDTALDAIIAGLRVTVMRDR